MNYKNKFIKILILLSVSLGLSSKAYSQLEGSVTSNEKIYKKGEAFSGDSVKQISQPAWKGEKIIQQLILWSDITEQNLSYEITDLTGASGTISGSDTSLSYIQHIKADKFVGQCGSYANRDYNVFDEMGDLVTNQPITQIVTGAPIKLLYSIQVPKTAAIGDYSGSIKVKVDGTTQVTFPVDIKVVDYTLPPVNQRDFHLDLWQFPALMVDQHNLANPTDTIDYWSPEHFALMTPHYTNLASLGQKVITAHIKDGALGSKSLIKWKRNGNNWSYDFSAFDAYVELLMGLGIDKQINSQSLVGWNVNSIPFYDEVTGTGGSLAASPGDAIYTARWGHFLTHFKTHLDSKGWFDKTYLYMDEVSGTIMSAVIDMVKANDPNWKIGLAHYKDISLEIENQIDDLSIQIGRKPLGDRTGKITTFYTPCSPSRPNNFIAGDARSAENVWMGWHTLNQGMDGFLRWAYDYWETGITDPKDTRNGGHTSGDFLLSYRSSNDRADMTFSNSLRSELINQGMQDTEKVKVLKSQFANSVDPYETLALAAIDTKIAQFTYSSGGVSTVTGLVNSAQQLLKDIITRQDLTEFYCSMSGSGDYHVSTLSTTGGSENISFTSSKLVDGYEYDKTSKLTLKPQDNFSVSFKNGAAYAGCSRVKTWIDWNLDGDFTDSGEEVYSNGDAETCNNGASYTSNLTVPANAVTGETRMRVRFRDSWLAQPEACGIATNAGGADFTINIEAGEVSYCSVGGDSSSDYHVASLSTTGGSEDISFTSVNVVDGYESHTASKVAAASKETVGVSFGNGSNYGSCSRVKAWVDWNSDGDFTDLGEEVYSNGDAETCNNSINHAFNLTVPTNMAAGETKMRIKFRDAWLEEPVSCGVETHAGAADFIIKIN